MHLTMTKKLMVLLVCLILLVVGGCSLSREVAERNVDTGELKIATSFYPIYIMALNITKDVPGVKLTNISPNETGCLHNVQLSPVDLLELETSDIFIINGLGMEEYLTKIIDHFPDLRVIDSNQNFHNQPDQHDRHSVNPHTWVSISLAIDQVKSIGKQLSEIDPVHEDHYMRNLGNYVAELERLKRKIQQGLEPIENRNIVTFHGSFPYFAEEFNLAICAMIQSEEGAEPSAKELAETIEIIKEKQIKGIFIEPHQGDAVAQAIARETNAQVYTLDPGVIGLPEPDAYIKAMEKNLLTLQEALKE